MAIMIFIFFMGQSISRLLFYPFDIILDRLQGYFNKQDKFFLTGNYAPVPHEWFVSNLSVQGSVPDDLVGEFLRNGPNPKNIPKGGYHWFDGDGMIHGVRFMQGGVANYVNRWTRTDRFKEESKANRNLYIRIGEMTGKLGLLKLVFHGLKQYSGYFSNYSSLQNGTANTALHYHNGTLMALVESDIPFAMNILIDGRLEELGWMSFDGKLKHPCTAHPKTDPETKEMIFFGYDIQKKPFCTYSVASREGDLLSSVDIGLKRPVMMHDFAISKNYSIFMDHPLEFQPKGVISGKYAFQFNANQPSRIGVIPRHGESASDVVWFDFKAGYSFHTANAWEEGDEVVMICCRSDDIQLEDLVKSFNNNCRPKLHEYRMNLKTGDSSERTLCEMACEFPVIHPDLVGRRNQYCYCAELGENKFNFVACIKVNLQDGSIIGRIPFGSNRGGGECVFVPKKDSQEEDDGYLLTFIFDEPSNSSELWIMDAKTMSPEPLATVKLPQRVPYGFHGLWVTEDQIVNQKSNQ